MEVHPEEFGGCMGCPLVAAGFYCQELYFVYWYKFDPGGEWHHCGLCHVSDDSKIITPLLPLWRRLLWMQWLFLWWLKAAVMCMSQVIDIAGCGRHLCIRRSAAAANHHAFKRVDAQLVAAEWADWYSLFWLRESSGNWGHCLEVSVPFLEVGEERDVRVENVKGKDSGVIYRLSILFC